MIKILIGPQLQRHDNENDGNNDDNDDENSLYRDRSVPSDMSRTKNEFYNDVSSDKGNKSPSKLLFCVPKVDVYVKDGITAVRVGTPNFFKNLTDSVPSTSHNDTTK